MIHNLIAFVAGLAIALGSLSIAIGVHDEAQPEDGTIIWVCEISGDGNCGPSTPPVQVCPDNLFRNWDVVF